MWVAGPYLISGIVAVAYTRAIPTLNGYMDKRQFGATRSQSSSTSSGYSSSSETTADGRVSRTTVYGGTPYTVTQTSQTVPGSQGASLSTTLQLGQNPAQVIQNPFPKVSMPLQTAPYSSQPLPLLGMPMLPLPLPMPPFSMPMMPSHSVPMSSFPMASLSMPSQPSAVMPPNLSVVPQALNTPQTIAPATPIATTGQALKAPTQVANSPAQAAAPLAQAPTTSQPLAPQASKTLNSPVQTTNGQSLPSQSSRVSPQVPGDVASAASSVPQPASSATGSAKGSNDTSHDVKQASTTLLQTARVPPQASEVPPPASETDSSSNNATSSSTTAPSTTNSTSTPTKAVVPESNDDEKTSQTTAQTKVVVPEANENDKTVQPNTPTKADEPDPASEEKTKQPATRPSKADTNGEEKVNQTSRTPTQAQEASTQLPPAANPVAQSSAEGTAPAPSSNSTKPLAVKPLPSTGAPESAGQANTTSGGPPRNFPVVGLPVGPHAQEVVSTKPSAGRPTTAPALAPATAAIQTHPTGTTAAPTILAQTLKTLPGTPPPAPTASAPALGAAPVKDPQLGVIPISVEAINSDGRPFKSEGVLKISNLVPAA